MDEFDKLTEILGLLRMYHHYECEDGFYSCPMHPDYFGPDFKDRCNCGLVENNANLDAALRIVQGMSEKYAAPQDGK